MSMRSLESNTLLVLVIVVTLAFAWILWPFFGAVLWAAVLAIVLAPLHRRLLGSISTRIVVVMQRVDQNDLVGYLQEQDNFEVLNLPAIATKTDSYHLGGGRTYTRQARELLHPAHEPAEALIELKREMGPIAFSAQYQQSPIPPGGRIIKRKWLKTHDQIVPQRGDRIVVS